MRPDVTSSGLPPWLEFFTFPSSNVVYVLVGCVVLGVAAGLVGCFAFLRKQSLIGDALAHAALPGVCVAFMLTGTKDPLIILGGAMVSCWLGALSVEGITRYTRCKQDSALGMVLSVFFGVGILLLTLIQHDPGAAKAGLDHFLFGKAAAMVARDVWVIAIVGGIMCVLVLLAYKEFKVVSFDPDFATSIGIPGKFVLVLLATMIVLTVGIGLQAVGVVLMAALLITPAASARYWTDSLFKMLLLASLFGGLGGAIGAYVSYLAPRMPTGPWIVVAVTTVFMVSLMFAPKRGMVGRLVRHIRYSARTKRENVLRTLYLLGERQGHWDDHYTMGEILQSRRMNPRTLSNVLESLEGRGYVTETSQGLFGLTEAGLKRAERLTRLHRLWELYLTRKLDLAPDHVHDDAEEIEHIITPELEAQLMEALEHPRQDPHERQIPGLNAGNRAESS